VTGPNVRVIYVTKKAKNGFVLGNPWPTFESMIDGVELSQWPGEN
jgi:hypothetical protein